MHHHAGSRDPDVASFDELLMVMVVYMQDESSILDCRMHSERRFEHFGFYQAMDVFSENATLELTERCYTMLND